MGAFHQSMGEGRLVEKTVFAKVCYPSPPLNLYREHYNTLFRHIRANRLNDMRPVMPNFVHFVWSLCPTLLTLYPCLSRP